MAHTDGGELSPKSEKTRIVGNYQLGKVIGRGSFGKVRVAHHIRTQTQVAVKVLERDKLSSSGDAERMAREIRVLQLLRHEHICNLYEVLETPTEILLVMEHASGGELFDHIVAQGHLKEPEARRVFGQIVAAVHYCHSNGVIHRDLKPENLLLDEARNIKVIDYGFANVVRAGDLMRTFCGSPAYAPPEMIRGHSYVGTAVDVWALGVILYALLAGYLPFDDPSVPELYKKVLAGKFKIPKRLSDDARDLIKRILVPEPGERLTLEEVAVHPFMTDNGRLPGVVLSAPVDSAAVASPDPMLMREAEALGFDPNTMLQLLQAGARTTETATYFLLRERRRREPDAPMLVPTVAIVASGSLSALQSPYKPRYSSPLAGSPDVAGSPPSSPSSGLAAALARAERRPRAGSLLSQPEDMPLLEIRAGSSATLSGAAVSPRNGGISPIGATAPLDISTSTALRRIVPAASSTSPTSPTSPTPITGGSFHSRRSTATAAMRSTSPGTVGGIVTGSSAPPVSAAATAAALLDARAAAGSKAPAPAAPLAPSLSPARGALNSSAPIIGLKVRERKGSIDVRSASSAGLVAADGAAQDAALRTVKGVFSVSTTSSRTPAEIVDEVTRVLVAAKIGFERNAYRFECQSPPDTLERDLVRFELEICRIPKISLRGLRLKRIHGDTWAYKRLCHSLVSQMVL